MLLFDDSNISYSWSWVESVGKENRKRQKRERRKEKEEVEIQGLKDGAAEFHAEDRRRWGSWRRGWRTTKDGEPVLLLTWPFQLPQPRLISTEVSSCNYQTVSRTRGDTRTQPAHAHTKHMHKHVAMDTHYSCTILYHCAGKPESKKIEIDTRDDRK